MEDNNFFKIHGGSNYNEKKKNGTTNGPNLRICMDIKFNIPGIPKTYRSPWLTELLYSPALKSDESLIIPIQWM